jgi:hypothetical protein
MTLLFKIVMGIGLSFLKGKALRHMLDIGKAHGHLA